MPLQRRVVGWVKLVDVGSKRKMTWWWTMASIIGLSVSGRRWKWLTRWTRSRLSRWMRGRIGVMVETVDPVVGMVGVVGVVGEMEEDLTASTN